MFTAIAPNSFLQPFIDTIWYCNRYLQVPEQTRTLPFGRMELVFKFSGEYCIKNGSGDFTAGQSWISGQQASSNITILSGQHECMGIVFSPLGWSAFSNIDAGDLKDQLIPGEDIFGNEFRVASGMMQSTSAANDKLQLLSNFISQQLVSRPGQSTIQEALRIIHGSQPVNKLTVSQLCKQLKISRKSLNRHFQKYIGLPASVYLRQKMFNSIIQHLSHNNNGRLVQVGYEYDFFDQSHFIKQFRDFAGMTPTQYIKLVENRSVDPAFPNFISV